MLLILYNLYFIVKLCMIKLHQKGILPIIQCPDSVHRIQFNVQQESFGLYLPQIASCQRQHRQIGPIRQSGSCDLQPFARDTCKVTKLCCNDRTPLVRFVADLLYRTFCRTNMRQIEPMQFQRWRLCHGQNGLMVKVHVWDEDGRTRHDFVDSLHTRITVAAAASASVAHWTSFILRARTRSTNIISPSTRDASTV